jgi:hypothetical protein
MSRRLFILTLACVAAGPLGAADGKKGAGEESFWSTLKSGGYVVLLRHAVTEPGIFLQKAAPTQSVLAKPFAPGASGCRMFCRADGAAASIPHSSRLNA